MARRVLGLDLGTRTGFAILEGRNGSSYRKHGTWDCSFRRGVDSPAVRIEKFRRALTDVLVLETIDKVFYEVVRRHNGVQAAHVYGALCSTMMEVCDYFETSYEGVDVGTWKKAIVLKGNAGKEVVVKTVRSFGFDATWEDEADAICIAEYGVRKR